IYTLSLHDALPIFIGGAVLDQLLPRERMLPIGERSEVFRLHLALQTPLCGQLAVPLAPNFLTLGVVVVFGVGELLAVIGVRLARAERFRDGQHCSASSWLPVM